MDRDEILVDMTSNSMNGYERNTLLENLGGRWEDTGYHRGADLVQDGRGVIPFDMDADGDLDLLVTNYRRRPSLLRNDTVGKSWLEVKLVGRESNRDAIGARIEATARGARQVREVQKGTAFLSTQGLVQHFGLADAAHVEQLTVTWPSGRRQVFENVPAGARIRIVEGEDAYARL
jgi:enediyne biosynthesis protein E4